MIFTTGPLAPRGAYNDSSNRRFACSTVGIPALRFRTISFVCEGAATTLYSTSRDQSLTFAVETRLACARHALTLLLRLGRHFLPDTLTYFENHLASFFIGIHDHVVPVQNLAVQNLQRQRVLHQFLNRSLQRTRSKVGIIAFGKEQFFG